MEKTTKLVAPAKKEFAAATNLLQHYLGNNIIGDFSKTPSYLKLSLLQNVKQWEKYKPIKTRKIGTTLIPYVTHQFATKALNFAFNFKINNEVVGTPEFIEYKINGKSVYEAWILMKFTFTNDQDKKIVKTVASSHKGWANPATSKYSSIQSAISKSWTVVAKTFGIASDLNDKEENAYRRAGQAADKRSEGAPVPKKKAWEEAYAQPV